MNMFKKVRATTRQAYLTQVPEDRRKEFKQLDAFIRKAVPGLKANFANNMLGYGSFPYLNYQKKLIRWPVIALANQKHYISLYICSVRDGAYVAETYKRSLGNVKVGKSCIRIKHLSEVDLPTLRTVLRLAAKYPGLR